MTTFVENIVAELRVLGNDVGVVTRNESKSRVEVEQRKDGLSSLQLHTSTLKSYDIVHIHGLWDLWLHRWAKAAGKASVKVVWSPHGMLQPWALKNKWWKKVAALALYQWRDLSRAAALHVTAQSEVDDVRRIGLKNPVIVAPLGVHLPKDEGVGVNKDRRKTLLFVSRVQRKKGLPTLLSAWAQLPQSVRTGWQVRVVGPDQDNHTLELKAQAEKLGILGDVDFVGPKYGAELAAEYRSADLFVLPTHSENFGSVVIEALAYGVPVICTKKAPWEELSARQCGWWIEDEVNSLCGALKEGLSLTNEARRVMGERGHKLVEEKYLWPAIGRQMAEAYREIKEL